MGIRERLSGNEAVAYAMKQINPDVMGAYPITPSTEIPQYFSTYVDNGEVDTLFIAVESEHSAMSTCIGAEAAGCRAISATSSCGLCYMTEMLYVAASDRLPITLAVSCRALSGPININNDHSDAMGVRDAGWLMLFAETNQEAYDNYLQAMRIAEAVSLPIMVCQDGFITSHAIENIELVETEKVKEFVGEYKPAHALLKPGEPMAVGAYATPVYYMEAKRQQAQAMMDAKDVIRKVGKEFGEMTGRTYGLIETYMMDDAEEAIVIIGSSAGTAKEAINELRAQGKKVGQIKVRSFRPFPSEDICEALKNVKAFAVMDKDDSFNAHCGPMFAEVTASLYAAGISGPKGINYIYGLGGRDVRVESIQHVFAELEKIADICCRNGVLVVADEIHCELTYPGHPYTPFASLSEEALRHSVTCISPSKAFNLAGIQIANIVAADEEVRRKIDKAININEVCDVNSFAVDALEAAYNGGEDWLEELKLYLYGNYETVRDMLGERLPQLRVLPLEGTYLVWIDCSALGLSSAEIVRLLEEEGRVLVNGGEMYGESEGCFIRLNIACPRKLLLEGVERICRTLGGRVSGT